MTDLEMTKLCAESLPLVVQWSELWGKFLYPDPRNAAWSITYDPLHNDAQAMALVKKFNLNVCSPYPQDKTPAWEIYSDTWDASGTVKDEIVYSSDLNRAIVECVAQIQLAKGEVSANK